MIKSVPAYLIDISLADPCRFSFGNGVSFSSVETVIETADSRKELPKKERLNALSYK